MNARAIRTLIDETVGRPGFEPGKGVSPPRLQRGPFGRLGTCPHLNFQMPTEGIEPPTQCLQNISSTAELRRRGLILSDRLRYSIH